MKITDRFLQNRRIAKAMSYIDRHDTVLDIGSGEEGTLFQKAKVERGIGIDPTLTKELRGINYHLYPGFFPKDLPRDLLRNAFTKVVALAVLEHIPTDQQSIFAQGCYEALQKGGLLIMTVPSAKVDSILEVLKFFKVVDGMSLEEHYGYKIDQTQPLFESAGFELLTHKSFQLGLNNLFVFKK